MNSASTRHPADSLKEPHCGAGFAEGCETSCLTLAMHRLLLNNLKHVTDLAPLRRRHSWTFGSHPHSHSVEHLLEHLHPFFSLFCHTGLLRELFLPAVGCALVSWVLGSQLLAVLLMVLGSQSLAVLLFFTAIWRVFHSTKSNDFNANFSFGITAAVQSMAPAQF